MAVPACDSSNRHCVLTTELLYANYSATVRQLQCCCAVTIVLLVESGVTAWWVLLLRRPINLSTMVLPRAITECSCCWNFRWLVKCCFTCTETVGAGIAQWLERRTRDWKVAGSNPCWNGGRIFFSRVDFLCWLLFRYPFHPRVTAVARKKSRSFCQKCRWQVTAKHAYNLRMWLLLNRASALVTTCP